VLPANKKTIAGRFVRLITSDLAIVFC